jgi:hypothetical protein
MKQIIITTKSLRKRINTALDIHTHIQNTDDDDDEADGQVNWRKVQTVCSFERTE